MPCWICEDCGSEFWGWSLSHGSSGGEIKPCPSCGGALCSSHGAKKAPCGDKSAA
ncbi:MAG: hypothetical protein AAB307_04435 [Deltaproteobacteria bacterium]